METVEINADINFDDARFPVQRVIRPQSEKFHDFRGFAGKVEGGVFKVGDSITALPSGTVSKIKKIYLGDSEVKEIYPPMSATLTLEDEIDITRGDLISKTDNQPEVVKELDVMLCWMNDKPLTPRGKYTIRHTANETMGMVLGVDYKVDINTLNKSDDDSPVSKNDICRAKIKVSKPLMIDSYSKNRGTGSIIIVDNGTNETVGAGMVV